MGLCILLIQRGSVLAMQGAGNLPPGMSQEQFDRMMSMMPFYVVFGLIALVAGIWMIIDAWNNYGSGWGIASCLGCLFFSWIAIIVYIIIRFAAAPPDKFRERTPNQGYYQPPAVYGGGQSAAPQDLELAPAERDERIDGLLAEGKAREAMDAAQEMLKMARDFKDAGGQKRYAKYVERIRLGIK
jgi:uncharacterized membrane protein (DUF485 family)